VKDNFFSTVIVILAVGLTVLYVHLEQRAAPLPAPTSCRTKDGGNP